MYFDYFDMLSGEPLWLEGVGHIKSPLLRDICPSSGIGYKQYNLYLNFLSWEKKHLLKYDKLMQYRGASKLDREQFEVFDIATLLKQTRELYRGVLSFFIVENIVWDEANRRFAVCVNGEDDKQIVIGEINRDNFDHVRKIILQSNFIGLDKDEAPIQHSSERSKELWERAQKYLEEQAKTNDKDSKPEYHISNIVSKLCAAHPSYNLLNIFNLTIFQLYDSFFQFGYLRSSDLNERIFSNHGGDYYAVFGAISAVAVRIVCIYSNVYVILIEMLGKPKAHTPKRSDEICTSVTVAKAEKRCEME